MACEEPEDPVIAAVEEAQSILRGNEWTLQAFDVIIQNEDLPPPFMVGAVTDSLEPGTYTSEQIFGNLDDVDAYRIQFTEDNTFLVDSSGNGAFEESGTYKIFGSNDIRLGLNGQKRITYEFRYLSGERTMVFNADEGTAGFAIDAYNQVITRFVVNETPTRIGDAVGRLLFENETIQTALNEFLVDLISGKLAFVNEIDPNAAADSVATMIVEALEATDWQTILSGALEAELNDITDIDPIAIADSIATQTAAKIREELNTETIFDFILPFMERIGELPPEQVAENIAIVVVPLILDTFDGDNLQAIIFPIWEAFTMLDDTVVARVADSLATLIERNRINQDSLSEQFLPVTTKIDATPITQMGTLAEEVTDSVHVQIDAINATFPDLNLSPDYGAIETAVTALLVALKPVIVATGPDAAADQIADLIIDSFLDHQTLKDAFISVINFFQAIDPGTAAATISQWLVNLVGEADQALIDFLTLKLSPIFEDFEPELTAFNIARALSQYIEANVTGQIIEAAILPVLEDFSNTNTEAVADYLAELILGSNLVQETFAKENIEATLLPVLEKLQETDTQAAAQVIIETIVQSNFFEAVITQERVSWIVSYLLYDRLWNEFKDINNFESVSIAIEHD